MLVVVVYPPPFFYFFGGGWVLGGRVAVHPFPCFPVVVVVGVIGDQ